MRIKILSIKQKSLTDATLPNGKYFGEWKGNKIKVKHKDQDFQLKVEDKAVLKVKVVVTIEHANGTFEELTN